MEVQRRGLRVRLNQLTRGHGWIADDNEANLELLSGMLTAGGYRVICARYGEHALAAVQKGLVDVGCSMW